MSKQLFDNNILTVHYIVYKQSILLYQYTLKTLGLSAFYISDINVKLQSLLKSNHKLYVVYILYFNLTKRLFFLKKLKKES